MRKFFRTRIVLELLEEGEPADLDLDSALNDCIGDLRVVHDVKSHEVEELDAKSMAKALADARSEPEFFDLQNELED